MPGFRLLIQPVSQGRTDAFDKGVCTGALIATSDNDPNICPPSGALSQAVRIVVQYIDGRPARLHESSAAGLGSPTERVAMQTVILFGSPPARGAGVEIGMRHVDLQSTRRIRLTAGMEPSLTTLK